MIAQNAWSVEEAWFLVLSNITSMDIQAMALLMLLEEK